MEQHVGLKRVPINVDKQRVLTYGHQRGSWVYSAKEGIIYHLKNGYWLKPSEMGTPAKLLEWYMEIVERDFVYSDSEAGELIRLINDVVDVRTLISREVDSTRLVG